MLKLPAGKETATIRQPTQHRKGDSQMSETVFPVAEGQQAPDRISKDGISTAYETEQYLHDVLVQRATLEAQVRELRATQRDLEASAERARVVYDENPVGYCTVDRTGRFTAANRTAALSFGVTREALMGQQLFNLVHTDTRSTVRTQLKRSLDSRSRTTGYARMDVPTIGRVDYQLTMMPDVAPDGAVSGCRVAVVDVSSLALSERRLHDLSNIGSTLSASFDFEQNLEVAVGHLVGHGADLVFADLFEGGTVRRVTASCAEPATRAVAEALRRLPIPRGEAHATALQNGEASAALASFAGSDQTSVAQACGARSLMSVTIGEGKDVRGLLVMVTTQPDRRYSGGDVAFAKSVASRLSAAHTCARMHRETEQALGNLRDVLPIVAHELKTPARSIRATVEQEPAPTPQQVRIGRAAQHLDTLLSDLSDPAQLEQGTFDVKREAVQLAPLVALTSELVAAAAAGRSLVLRSDVSEALRVNADARRVVQALANVLLEVIEACPERSAVFIGASVESGGVQLTVRAEQAVLPKQLLFELFQQSWAPRKGAARPVSIGLYVAKRLIEAHGGAIWMESLPKQGAAFHFTLPPAD